MNIFWGMKILWITFLGHLNIGLYLEVISMHLEPFPEVKVQNIELHIIQQMSCFIPCHSA